MAENSASVVQFWRDAGPKMWFAKDADFDRRFRDRFLELHEAAARREFRHWLVTAEGALALVLLLDQYPRNGFRDTPRMYATDALACEIADLACLPGQTSSLADWTIVKPACGRIALPGKQTGPGSTAQSKASMAWPAPSCPATLLVTNAR